MSAELRRQGDVEAIAARLLAVIMDPKTPAREVLQAIQMFGDRTEGRAVSRNMNVRMTAADMLPAGFDGMSLEQRRAALHSIRERAVAGALPAGETDAEDQE